jgi:plastocyanin
MYLRTHRAAVLAALTVALTALFVACGSDDSTGPGDGPFTGTIHVLDDRFSPSSVTISVGDSVTWSWDGNHSHTVTQGTTPDASQDPTRLFDHGPKTSGTFGFRFTSAATVPYFCRVHFSSGMKGTVTVKP